MNILKQLVRTAAVACALAFAYNGSFAADEQTQSNEPENLPTVDVPTDAEITASIDKGIAFLIQKQNANGSWGSATRTKSLNIYAPVPGAHHAFRTATTALCISALLESAPKNPNAMQAGLGSIRAGTRIRLNDVGNALQDSLLTPRTSVAPPPPPAETQIQSQTLGARQRQHL